MNSVSSQLKISKLKPIVKNSYTKKKSYLVYMKHNPKINNLSNTPNLIDEYVGFKINKYIRDNNREKTKSVSLKDFKEVKFLSIPPLKPEKKN